MKFCLSIIIAWVGWILRAFLIEYRGILLNHTASLQVEDSNEAYAQALITADLCHNLEWIVPTFCCLFIIFLWKNQIQERLSKKES